MTNGLPIVGVVGSSGAGKTTLVSKLIERLGRRGLRIGALKHNSHGFQMDHEGKDTFRFRAAGAYAVGIASSDERAILTRTERPSTLDDLLAALPGGLDLVLVEGYHLADIPKIEVVRRGVERRPVGPVDAIATDDPALLDGNVPPRFRIDDVDGIARFIGERSPAIRS